jgi:hypothetical protein
MYYEIQSGAVAESYMRKGFFLWGRASSYEEMRKYFPIYEEAVSHSYMILQLLHSEFPYIWGKIWFSFLSVQSAIEGYFFVGRIVYRLF